MSFDLPYQLVLLITAACGGWLWRAKVASPGNAALGVGLVSALAALLVARDAFHVMRHMAWLLFVHLPLWLLIVAVLARRRRVLARICVAGAVVLIAVAVDAFLIEPHALEITRYTLSSSKLSKRVRIVVMSDIQTDHVGDYERQAFEQANAEHPDLVLLPGDYLQTDAEGFAVEGPKLAKLLSTLKARLGAWAVEGNVEPPHWQRLFEGTPVRTFDALRPAHVSHEITVTGMTLRDSFDVNLEVAQSAGRFHIVFGHAPDFSLGTINADLLIAGHTHGGQVRLPPIGPLITLSRVPRRWAAGLTTLPGERSLIVSRGIGMERGYAPRLRFLCRPELVVIDVVPAS